MNITTMPASAKVTKEKKLLHNLRGSLTVILITLHTLAGFPFILAAAFLKLILPLRPVTTACTWILTNIATIWIDINNLIFRYLLGVKIITGGDNAFNKKGWYLVLSNHQSWVDIVVLQMIFNRRIPLLKFFIKQELIRVPFLGIAWWALDFPFMKRYRPEFLKENPHLKGKDIEITRKACKKFRRMPVSVMNFVEGTRFSQRKHDRQNSPYKNLLKPRAGGTGFVFTVMGDIINDILDVTIVYPQGDRSFWNFLCGRIHEVDVNIEKLPVTPELKGDYESDPAYRERFCKWINDLWEKKDKLIDRM